MGGGIRSGSAPTRICLSERSSTYVAVGIDEFVIDQPRPEQLDVLEEVASDVLPGLRSGLG